MSGTYVWAYFKAFIGFSDWGEYDAVIHSRGAIVLRELERRVGKASLGGTESVFNKTCIKTSTQDFIEAKSGY